MNFDEYLKHDYDLICIIDAFEHLNVKDGEKFISEAIKKCRYLLISIPRYVNIQSGLSEDPNKFEEHRAFWTRSMFKSAGKCIIIPNNARKTIALFSRNGHFDEEIRKFCTKKLLLKFTPYLFIDAFNFLNWFINRNNKGKYLSRHQR
jgi:hypothetical protein